MTGNDLKSARTASNWTQAEAAHRLGVTQAYLSMVERGNRPVSDDLTSAALRVFSLPATARPIEDHPAAKAGEAFFKRALGELGYHSYQSDSQHADASGNYYEVIKGSGSYSGLQIKSLGEEMCEHHSDSASADRYTHIDQRTVSPAAVQAWQECTRNTLLSTTTSWQDTDQGTVGMDVSFHLAGGGNDATVKAVRAENLSCTSPDVGRLINKGGAPVKLGLTSYTLQCKRTVQNAPFQSGTRKVYADVARLTIDTSVGPITRDLPAVLPPLAT